MIPACFEGREIALMEKDLDIISTDTSFCCHGDLKSPLRSATQESLWGGALNSNRRYAQRPVAKEQYPSTAGLKTVLCLSTFRSHLDAPKQDFQFDRCLFSSTRQPVSWFEVLATTELKAGLASS